MIDLLIPTPSDVLSGNNHADFEKLLGAILDQLQPGQITQDIFLEFDTSDDGVWEAHKSNVQAAFANRSWQLEFNYPSPGITRVEIHALSSFILTDDSGNSMVTDGGQYITVGLIMIDSSDTNLIGWFSPKDLTALRQIQSKTTNKFAFIKSEETSGIPELGRIYQFVYEDLTDENLPSIVEPDDGGGRWFIWM
jgi:hypothetical protein